MKYYLTARVGSEQRQTFVFDTPEGDELLAIQPETDNTNYYIFVTPRYDDDGEIVRWERVSRDEVEKLCPEFMQLFYAEYFAMYRLISWGTEPPRAGNQAKEGDDQIT